MRICLCLLILLLVMPVAPLRAQKSPDDPLRTRLAQHPQADTVRVNNLLALAGAVRFTNYVEALQLGQEALELARKLAFSAGEANALLVIGTAYGERNDYEMALRYMTQARQRFEKRHDRTRLADVTGQIGWINTQQGDYVSALSLGLQSLNLARAVKDSALICRDMAFLGSLYTDLGDYTQALSYYTSALEQYEQAHQDAGVCKVLNGIGEVYRYEGDSDKAVRYYNKAIRLARALNNTRLEAETQSNLAAVQVEKGQYRQALGTGHEALRVLMAIGQYEVIAWTQAVLAHAHLQTNGLDSAIYYGQRAWNLSRQIGYKETARDASDVLARAYAGQKNFEQAYVYQRAYTAYDDTLSGRQTQQQLALLQHDVTQTERQAAATLRAEEDRRQQQLLFSALAGLSLLGVVAVVLWRSNRQQHRTNGQLRQQQAEIQAAQAQLIQREKMASLGELTAGIAHEIQNPLNFVNNFAEVSVELVDELNEEVMAGRTAAGDLLPLTGDLRQNLTKIHHHGQRADAIVRAMLQHSRVSTGERQPTDLNALADEYLRLSYHGLRAKDKAFNAELITRFDPTLGKLSVVSQDISRVLLNLINNAFYAVSEKKKQLAGAGTAYQPQVSVETKKRLDGVEIRVRDNGNGIPDAVLDKIYQPFFTTKPSGEGTGLGLSLSYDIITKGHGGTLSVTTKPGEFTEFVITLPGRTEIAVS